MARQPSNRVKSAAADYPVPQTDEEANDFIARIGEAQRERTRIETAMNDALAALKEQYEDKARPHKTQIEALTQGVQVFCEANRARLTRDGKVKFYRFGAGEVCWRTRPLKVSVCNQEVVIAALKRLDLGRFLRVKEEVNKEAMLAEPDVARTVAGVTVGSAGEDFVIKPFETELEEVA